jgi:hypothetical protein
MESNSQGKQKKKYSKPEIYKIEPDDPRISHLKKLFEQPEKEKSEIIGELTPESDRQDMSP